jgi:lipoprotein-releasing system permease protein
VVIGACFWLAAGMGAACLWYPLSNVMMVPPPNPPSWMVVVLGLTFVLPTVAIIASIVLAAKGRSCRFQLWVGLHWGVISIAAFGLLRKASTELGMESANVWLGLLLAHFALAGPAACAVLLQWSRRKIPSRPALVLAIIAFPLAGLVWLATGVLQRKPWSRSAVAFTLMLCFVAGELFILRAAYTGAAEVLRPVLLPKTGATLWAAIVGLLVASSVLAAGLALFHRKTPSRRSVAEHVALVCLLLAIVVATALTFRMGVLKVGTNLAFVGGWDKYTPPMEFIIPCLVAAALGILSLVLLAARSSFSFFTTVSIGGVTIGTMALVIVLSVMSGFETDLREKILGFNAHIQVTHNDELQFTGYQDIEKILSETDGVIGYTPFLMTEAYMSNHNNYGNVTLKGIDPARVAGVTEIVHNLVKGDERALEKIWPLGEDGSIVGAPSAAPEGTGPEIDFDLDEGPVDFSGGAESVDEDSAGETEDDSESLEDEDLDLGEIEDFSGGLDEYVELLDGGVDADAGPLDGAEDEELVEPAYSKDDWDLPVRDQNFVRPEVAVLDGLLVGQELVNQISLYTGQEIRIISPLPDTSPDGLSIPRLQNFRIAGKFFSGMYEYDLKYVYCSLSALQSFLDLGDEVNGIEVRVKDPAKTDAIVRKLETALGPEYRVQDWKELNKALFSALKLEKIAMFFILVIIVLVASFSIVGNLIMVVIEKAKEIAILKTLGSSNRGVMNIFITQGFFIGLVGTSLGLALGLGACWLGMTYGVPLDPDVYYIDKLPIQVEPWSVVIVGFAGVAISVVATIYPAFIAARMRPVKGLRWD